MSIYAVADADGQSFSSRNQRSTASAVIRRRRDNLLAAPVGLVRNPITI